MIDPRKPWFSSGKAYFYAAPQRVLRYGNGKRIMQGLIPSDPCKTPEQETRHARQKVPAVTFRTRVRDEAVGGPNPFRWQDMTSDDYFKGKKVVLFSLPGAFTPTCSTYQAPRFRKAGAGIPRARR